MTLWSSVADCWKDGDKMQFDAGVLESVFPADHDQKQKRSDIFKAMDGNGNGYVSLAEFDDWFNRATCARERLHGLKPVEGKSGDTLAANAPKLMAMLAKLRARPSAGQLPDLPAVPAELVIPAARVADRSAASARSHTSSLPARVSGRVEKSTSNSGKPRSR